jgi:hypothetical protein
MGLNQSLTHARAHTHTRLPHLPQILVAPLQLNSQKKFSYVGKHGGRDLPPLATPQVRAYA